MRSAILRTYVRIIAIKLNLHSVKKPAHCIIITVRTGTVQSNLRLNILRDKFNVRT